jgi:hypothetical protein
MLSSRNRLGTAALILGACLLLWGCGKRRAAGSPPVFPTNAPVVISINVTSPRETNFSIQDPKHCEAILAALGPAQEVPAHKCKKSGEMIVTLADQKSLYFQILPGHNSSNAEYVYEGKYYSGPGADFYKALRTAGVDTTLLK